MHCLEKYNLEDTVVIITGGAGLLGLEHAYAVCEAGGMSVLWDLNQERLDQAHNELKSFDFNKVIIQKVDVTDQEDIQRALDLLLQQTGKVDVLINNVANNPKVDACGQVPSTRFEAFSLEDWQRDIQIGLTSAFLCSQVIGRYFSQEGRGNIVNIVSDLGIIAPDQRIYHQDDIEDSEQQNVKPVTYSVVKHALVGLTRYLATYWTPQKAIRCNALAPGGVYNGQPDDFVQRVSNLIPMGRLARKDEYRGAIQFLVSSASSYMNGTVLVIDGGRSCW